MATDLPTVVTNEDPTQLVVAEPDAALVVSAEESVSLVMSENPIVALLSIGTQGPPGSASGGYRAQVEPVGPKNGTNTTFTLPESPIIPTFELYQNGLLEDPANYTLAGVLLTVSTPPKSWWRLAASYFV